MPVVICSLAALAPLRIPATFQKIAAAAVTCLLVFMLSVRERQTAGMVAELAPVYDAKPLNRGLTGAIISGSEPIDGLNFNPYFWAGALYAQQAKGILLNSWRYGPISVFATREAHEWEGASPQRLREILLEGKEPVSPQIAFLCGGKWDPAQAEMEASSALARRMGLAPTLDSHVYYCYSAGIPKPVGQARMNNLR